MKVATQTKIISGIFGMFDSVRLIAESGFDCIDVTFSEPDLKEWLSNASYNTKAKDLKHYAQELGVTFNQAHAPVPSDGKEGYSRHDYENFLRTLELSSLLGVKNIVFHPMDYYRRLGTYEESREKLRESNLEFFTSLIPYCEEYNINVAIENTYWRTDNGIEKSYCSGAEDIMDLVDTIDSSHMVSCLDLGHLALAGENHREVITSLGRNRLKCLHVQDNEFVKDIHQLPGVGKIDYKEILSALADIDYDGELTLESYGFIKGFDKEFIPAVLIFMAKRVKFLANEFDRLKSGRKM